MKNPYPENKEQAGENLRLTIAFLTKHNISISPLNYRLGYDYISDKDADLKKSLEEVLPLSDRTLSERLLELYQRLYMSDEKTLNDIRRELNIIIKNLQRDIELSGGKLYKYAGRLNQFAAMLNTSPSPQTMATEVEKVIEETRETELSQRRFNSQLSQITSEMESLRKEVAQIKEESHIDSLTGIGNRKAFDTKLEEIVNKARLENSTFCLLVADVDYFKRINDSYGHLLGDKVLRFVASTLKLSVKGKDFVARFGGEEFAVILQNTNMAGGCSVAEQIRQAVCAGRIHDMKNQTISEQVTISIGVAQFHANDIPYDLLQRADQALYLAKEEGRNRVSVVR